MLNDPNEMPELKGKRQRNSFLVLGTGMPRISKLKVFGKKDKIQTKTAGTGYNSARDELRTPQKRVKKRK